LAEFNFIDPPLWSADSNWLAFRVQDGLGGEDVYVVRRDGSELTNVTATEKLPAEDHPYILSGWINDNLILRSGNPAAGGLVYLRRVTDGFTKPLFDTPWDKSDMVPSPDGSFLAYPDINGQKTLLKLLSPDGKAFRDLAAFQAFLYRIVWSPDGLQIAFTKMDFDPKTARMCMLLVGMVETCSRSITLGTPASTPLPSRQTVDICSFQIWMLPVSIFT
jgi:Tol biopolymer transport system component